MSQIMEMQTKFDPSRPENSKQRSNFIARVDAIPFTKAAAIAEDTALFDADHAITMHVRNELAGCRSITMEGFSRGLAALARMEELTAKVREYEGWPPRRDILARPVTIDSREVAQMVGKRHADLLRDIENYKKYLDESIERKIALNDFFVEATYRDSIGRTLKRYEITKKGCEFIAHKLTGQKGAIFTATYINRFHEMEGQLNGPKAQQAPAHTTQQLTYGDLTPFIEQLRANTAVLERMVTLLEGQHTPAPQEPVEAPLALPDPRQRATALLTRREAAAYLGVSLVTLDRVANERGFPARLRVGIGRGRVYFNRDRLDEWIYQKAGQ